MSSTPLAITTSTTTLPSIALFTHWERRQRPHTKRRDPRLRASSTLPIRAVSSSRAGRPESTNLVAYSWVRRKLGPGDEILSTVMEHHSNIVPWQMAAKDSGATLRYLPVTDDGELDVSELDSYINDRTKLVCVAGMSNVLGTINDLEPIVKAAYSVGALVLVDGAQLVPHVTTDFQAIGCDFLAFSSHKMLGPLGIGVSGCASRTARGDGPVHGRRRDDPRRDARGSRRGTTCPTSSRAGR